MNIKHYAAAGFPAVAIATSDEDRAVANILAAFPQRDVLKIACMGGLIDAKTDKLIDEQAEYPAAFARAASRCNQVIIVLDYQHIIKTPAMYRLLRDALPRIKSVTTDPTSGKFASLLVLVAPSWKFPAEVEHDIAVINDSLPSREELDTALQVCIDARPESMRPSTDARNMLLNNACGQTLTEAENSFALAGINGKAFDPAIVAEQKMKIVRQSGLAEIIPHADSADLGGLGELKKCIDEEIIPSMSDSDIAVNSIILDGVPGTGKSLAARIISGKLGYPIMRVDMQSLKARSGGIVGQSENGLIELFKLARAIAPVVLFFDETEKGFKGGTSNNDSGVSGGMLGIMLTQTQDIRDRNEKVFFVYTTNDFQALPTELTRRMEIKFFVDIPSRAEREEIAAKKLSRYSKDASLAADIADLTEDWTGSEIEDLVRSAARRSRRNITLDVLKAASADIRPIAKTRADEISRLRAWGKANLRLANSQTVASKTKRSISTVD